MSNSSAGSMSAWSGLLKDLFRQINDGSITVEQLQAFVVGHKNPFDRTTVSQIRTGIAIDNSSAGSASGWFGLLEQLFHQVGDGSRTREQLHAFVVEHKDPFVDITTPQIRAWEKFYQDHFGLRKVDFSQVVIPERKEGFKRLIIVAKGMDPQNTFNACNKKFNTWKAAVKNLNRAIIHEDRSAKKGTYAIWVRDRVEADKEYTRNSADYLEHCGVQGITLTERLLYELKYYDETGKHLDIHKWTMCSGSRRSHGYVPRVNWGEDENLLVDRCASSESRGGLRTREVVS